MGPLFCSSVAAVQRAAGCWRGEVTGEGTQHKPIYPPPSYSSLTEKVAPSQGPLTQSEGLALPLEFIKQGNKALDIFFYAYHSL